MIAYFDTSALVKIIVQEAGSAAARRTWRASDAVVASLLLYPEARAAIAGARRSARLTATAEHEATRRLNALVDAVAFVAPTRDLLWAAGDLAQRHALRGYDAVHLASAVEVGPAIEFVTADHRLARAASTEGLRVVVTT